MTRPDKNSDTDAPRASEGPPTPFDWQDYVDALVTQRGSLAAAAAHLCERRGFSEDQGSVERGLRRLRERGTKPGGVWGDRALRCFGLPTAVDDRVRWMGQYHTRFNDLPTSVTRELLRPWDRPPVSESATRLWLLLARVSLALRLREREPVPALLDQASALAPRSEPAARVELALVEAYVFDRDDPPRSEGALERAGTILDAHRASLERQHPDDYACLFSRWIDQSAYPLNKPRPGAGPPDPLGALELYTLIPSGGPPFARCRRHNGLGWTHLSLGEGEAARRHAMASVEAAGDSGSLRLRAMALNLLATTCEARGQAFEAKSARARAVAIARRLEDEALILRFSPR